MRNRPPRRHFQYVEAKWFKYHIFVFLNLTLRPGTSSRHQTYLTSRSTRLTHPNTGDEIALCHVQPLRAFVWRLFESNRFDRRDASYASQSET